MAFLPLQRSRCRRSPRSTSFMTLFEPGICEPDRLCETKRILPGYRDLSPAKIGHRDRWRAEPGRHQKKNECHRYEGRFSAYCVLSDPVPIGVRGVKFWLQCTKRLSPKSEKEI